MSFVDELSGGTSQPAIVNERTGRILASTVEVARTSAARRKGLLGRDELPYATALVISRCNAVHTIGMRFAIDVAFVDSRGQIRKIVNDLGPWRMAMSPFASTTIEFPAGSLDDQAARVGDRLIVAA
jgi:uncharacterized membrane protein (UPF0127 family)